MPALPYDLPPAAFAWLCLAAFLVGGAKTGLSGIGILAVPIFASVFPPFQSAALLLPTLVVADIVAVAAWRRHGDQKLLWPMVPWVLLGTLGFSLFLWWAGRPDAPMPATFIKAHLKQVLGVLVLAMLALTVWKKSAEDWLRQHPHAGKGTGVVAGIATTLNAAGPVMNLYLLAQRLPKAAFIGTGAWFFLTVNILKLPILGLAAGADVLSWDLLRLTLWLSPCVLLGCWLGFRLVHRLPEKAFQITVRLLVLASGIKLLFG